MAELESSLISELVTAGMKAAEARGRHLGRPPIAQRIVSEIEALAASTDLSVRQIQKELAGKVSRGVVGEITKRVRSRSRQRQATGKPQGGRIRPCLWMGARRRPLADTD